MSGSYDFNSLITLALGLTVGLLGLALSVVIPRWLSSQFVEEEIDCEYPPVTLPAVPLRLLNAVLFLGLLLSSVWLLSHMGINLQAAAALFFCLITLTLAHIDARTGLLPDVLTLPLLVSGLVSHAFFGTEGLVDSFAGAALGYGLLRGIFSLYLWKTGTPGMGHGDFKLAAALGAWLGLPAVPVLLLLASASGVVVGLFARWTNRLPEGSAIPFGPFLAVAGILILFWGNTALWPGA